MAIIIDGKKIAQDIKASLKEEVLAIGKKLRLAVVLVGDNVASKKFIEQKKKFGRDIGVDVKVYEFAKDVTTNQLRKKLAEIVHIKQNAGVIIQLPLAKQINAQYILNSVIPAKDVDVLSAKSLGDFTAGKSKILPPVVGAIQAILQNYKIDVRGKNVAVVGAGRLVGQPTAIWLVNEGASVSTVNEFTKDIKPFLERADIIISGAGKPKLITVDMVKEGVVIIDAGTSESAGKLVGDVDFQGVSKKASLITPVPGGVGPLTVAMLFKNLLELAK